jgi:hypothetical protein
MNEAHFFQFNLTYDKTQILELYEQYIHEFPAEHNLRSPFLSISDSIDLTDCPAISAIMDCVPLIPSRTSSYQLTSIYKNVHAHTNPGNNGTIFFPVSGELEVDFYSWPAPLDEHGRPLLSPMPDTRPKFTDEEKAELDSSIFTTIKVDRPIAINGLKVHGYRPVSLEPPICFVIRIPLDVDWDDLIQNHIRYE